MYVRMMEEERGAHACFAMRRGGICACCCMIYLYKCVYVRTD